MYILLISEHLQNKFEELKNNFTREMENKMEIVLVEVKSNYIFE
jgi:hypothetical protein